MTKKKSQAPSALTHVAPMSEWSKIRESERIKYSDGAPERAGWMDREKYNPKELQYRGKVKSEKIFLSGRPL